MWPFRRRLSISSPELVSAVPISQDEVIENDTYDLTFSPLNNNNQEKVESWTTNSSAPVFAVPARKGLSTWGKKVGRKWDDIKRSDSSDLPSVCGKKYQLSRNSQSSNSLENPSVQSERKIFLKPRRILRVKSLRNLFRQNEKCQDGSTIDESRDKVIKEKNYADYKIDKSLSEGVIRLTSSLRSHVNQDLLSDSKRVFSYSTIDIDKQDDFYFLNNTGTIRTKIQSDDSNPRLTNKQNKSESDLRRNVEFCNDNTENIVSGDVEKKSAISNGLEDLVNNMKLGCDESGYDSDSTRTGADSPDCEKLNLKVRSGSITSEDYQAVNISKNDLDNKLDPTKENGDLKTQENVLDETLKASENDPDKTITDNSPSAFECLEPQDQIQTPKKKLQSRISDAKSLRKKYKSKDSATISLLDETASPYKDTPPVHKIPHPSSPTIPYYVPKRPRPESDILSPDSGVVQIVKRAALEYEFSKKKDMTKKSLFTVEYEMVKLKVQQNNLGLSIVEKENGKTGYVISKIDPTGDAAKCGQFRLGDEIIRVCGKRVKRIALSEARSLIQNACGDVEIYIGRQPSSCNFSEDRPFEWPESKLKSSTSMEEEVWCRKDSASMDLSCEIVGFHKKDGQFLPVDDFGELEEPKDKISGMKKFHVEKRPSSILQYPRRAMSLSMDTLTVILEKGAKKKLGFTIVGGSDSEKGNIGIFVENITPDGQAITCLRAGDEILAINGISMDGLTHQQALQTIRVAKPGEMIIHIRRRDSTHLKRLHQL